MVRLLKLIAGGLFFVLPVAWATTSPISYHGRILKPDGTVEQDSSVLFKITISSPGAENCLMYSESQTVNMSGSDGIFSLNLNSSSSSRLDSSGLTFEQVMANLGTYTFPSGSCSSGTTYTPGTYDGRVIQVYFQDSSMSSLDAFPSQSMVFVPKAIDCEQVAGFPATSLLRVENGSTPGVASALTTAQLTTLMSLINGSEVATDGTAAAPGIAFSGDTTTGIYDNGSGTIGFSSGGVAAATLSGTGLTLAANEGLTMSSGTGTFSQTYTGTSNASSITADSLGAGSSALTVSSSTTASGTATGISSILTGAATTNVAGYFSASGATSNYGLLVANGDVGIGTTSPVGTLDILAPTVPGASVNVAYFRSSPSNTGGYSNNVWLDNTYGSANYKNQLIFASQGTSKWSIGTDLFHSGQQNFFIYDTTVGPRLLINQSGWVGLGTSNPLAHFNSSDSTAQTVSYTGVLHSIGTTSSTASINKTGMDIESTGTWNGSGSVNTGLKVNATGGTSNYAAVFLGGSVGVGTASPSYNLHVYNTGTAGAVAGFTNSAGTCSLTPSSSSAGWSCTSDETLKKNIEAINGQDVLDRIMNLQAVTYQLKKGDSGERHTGYIAQKVQVVAPEFVTKGPDGLLQVSYTGFIPWITEAIKELNRHVSLKADEVTVDAKMQRLEAENEKLRQENYNKSKELTSIEAYLCEKDSNAPFCKR